MFLVAKETIKHAIAATLDEEDAKKTAVFHDKDGVNEWLNSIEKEIW